MNQEVIGSIYSLGLHSFVEVEEKKSMTILTIMAFL